MIEFKNVNYTYFSKFYTLFNFSYQFNPGNYCLIGDNVSGGLTLIRLLAKLDTYYKGEILIKGTSLKKVNYKKNFNVAYISSTPAFFNHKTVLENLAHPLKIRGIKKVKRNNIALNALTNFNWQDKADVKVEALSCVDKIMLAIIRASIRQLDLLLCEDIWDKVSIEILNKINAATKIIVTNTDLNLQYYNKLVFNLGQLDNKND